MLWWSNRQARFRKAQWIGADRRGHRCASPVVPARRYCRSDGHCGTDVVSMSRVDRCLVNRYYDPSTDQFISVDPLVSETGQPFSYADDDPVNGSDPSGLDFFGAVADSFNPFSPNNVFNRFGSHHPLGGKVVVAVAGVGVAAGACYLACPLLIGASAAEGEDNRHFGFERGPVVGSAGA